MEQAAELYTTAMRFPVIARSRWFEAVVGRHLTALTAGLDTLSGLGDG